MNELHYQSAASDLLVPDGEINSTKSTSFDINTDDLCSKLERDLIAKGIVTDYDVDDDDNDHDVTPRDNASNFNNSTCRESIATVFANDQKLSQDQYSPDLFRDVSDEKSKAKSIEEEKQNRIREDEEDEKRLKLIEELCEQARLEEEERNKRKSLVDSILTSTRSKSSQTP